MLGSANNSTFGFVTVARRALEEAVKRNKAETELAVMPSTKQVPTGRHT
jgi:hypothetical protein